jgi:hypothetical protein
MGERFQTTLRISPEIGAWIVESAERGGYRSVNEFLCDLVEDARANGAAPTAAAAAQERLPMTA